MRTKFNFKSLLFYAVCTLLQAALNMVLPKVPLSLGLCFSLLICGVNPIAALISYVLASAVSVYWLTSVLSLFEGGFLTLITLLYRRTGKKIRAEAAAYMAIALTPFVAFSSWNGIEGLYFTQNAYIIKAIAAVTIIAFAYFAFKSVHALMFRICRCRLRPDELMCIAVFFAAVGTGVCSLVGRYAYICISAAVTCFFIRLFKGPQAIIAAIVCALPPFLLQLDLSYVTAGVIICVFALIFCSVGRWAICLICAMGTALWLLSLGMYSGSVLSYITYTLLLCLVCTACAAIPEEKLKKLYALLTLEKVLPRAESERLKERAAAKLYKMSEVFREIESAFLALDDGPDEEAMKRRMLAEAKARMCTGCNRAETCKNARVYKGFAALIETGCLKGKVSFVDLSGDVTKNCKNPSSLTETVNKLLYEYRKATLEAENAKNGRKLLAEQARGVADVLKNRAVELCRDGGDFSGLERKVAAALTAGGVACPEIEIKNIDGPEVSLTLFDCRNFAAAKACVESVVGERLILKEKFAYDGHKCAYLLVKPPKYDAAFGVAHCVKDGEKASGDTHSVIKINEHSFLMALSDGMGSGEYAKKVSETAISLMEAFCRSEMPGQVMLDVVNKLLCFNRDERFTCIDAATVDLNTLSASFIKIGSPVGLIVRKGEIKVLESRSLPLGILDSVRPSTSREQLKKDDIVVFMSDGITSAFDGVNELYEFVGGLKPLNPQALADNILAAARQRSKGVPDDMTVLCVRVFKAEQD